MIECEIEWLHAFDDSLVVKIQNGAHHSTSSRIHRLEQWLAVAPAVLPRHCEPCYPALSHPDLSASKILIKGEESNVAISGIIDWQGATVPFFQHTRS